MYECKLILHSISPEGVELLTYEIVFPRIVLAEVVTHRILSGDPQAELLLPERTSLKGLSKNTASSRAIPFTRMVEAVKADPYIPERWSRNGRGMQESGWLDEAGSREATAVWLRARDAAVCYATRLHAIGVHKQEVNRLLEPWAWTRQILTGTEWNNFFALRTDKDAHPAFRTIARMMYLAYQASEPVEVDHKCWHAPYVGQGSLKELSQKTGIPEEDVLKVSAARCAWVSYDPPGVDGFSVDRARATFDKLMGGRLKHASPVEHQAHPALPSSISYRWRSNFRGWVQYRKYFSNENVSRFYPTPEELKGWCDESEVVKKYNETALSNGPRQ